MRNGKQRLPLLCALGRHDTGALAQWNDGYYFARCRRCGHDVVRTAFGRWTIPRGYRIIWADHPPRHAPSAWLMPVGEAPRVSGERVEFPIVEPSHAPAEVVRIDSFIVVEAPAEPATAEAQASAPHVEDELPSVGPVPVVIDSDAEPEPAPPTLEADAPDMPPIGELTRNLRDGDPDRDAARMPAPPMAFFAAPEDEREDAHVLPRGSDPPEEPAALLAEDEASDEPGTEIEPELIPPPPATLAPPPVEPSPVFQLEPQVEPEAQPEPEPQPTSPSNPLIPDFMNETAFEVPYDLQTGRILRSQERQATTASPQSAPTPPEFGPSQPVSPPSSPMPNAGSVHVRVGASDGAVRDRPGSLMERYSGIAAATIFGAFVLAAALVNRSDVGSTPISYRPIVRAEPPAPLPAMPTVVPAAPARRIAPDASAAPSKPPPAADAAPAGDLAFVTASTLNCRAGPDDDSPTIRKLLRGASVQVLGAGSGWVSVSHRGRQCWADAKYLSTSRPA